MDAGRSGAAYFNQAMGVRKALRIIKKHAAESSVANPLRCDERTMGDGKYSNAEAEQVVLKIIAECPGVSFSELEDLATKANSEISRMQVRQATWRLIRRNKAEFSNRFEVSLRCVASDR